MRSEIARVRARLAHAHRTVARNPPRGLTAAQSHRRARLLDQLAAYTRAERYPCNHALAVRTPVFVDRHGTHCAVADLLASTREHALVARIARASNLARIADLADDPHLGAWLRHHGLTVSDAARIQPSYSAHTTTHWQPTVSLVAGVQGGASTVSGAQLALAPGVRAGARLAIEHGDDNGAVHYRSLAFVLEYTRSFLVGIGSANHVALLAQWDLSGSNRDAQWYVLGGPLASLDEDTTPGWGAGAQAALGFSFRGRTVPWFAEATVHGLAQGGGGAVRGGLNLGVVW